MLKRNKSIVASVVAAVFLYCLLGFLLLPGIALHVVNNQFEQRLNVEAQLHSLEFNPFTLELTLGRLAIGEKANPLLSFQRLHANLQLSSLWSDALELESLTIERARVAATLQQSGDLNLLQMIRGEEPELQPTEETSGALFPVRIAHLNVNDSQLQFRDQQPAVPVQTHFEQITIQAQQFSTVAQEATELSLHAQGPAQSQLQLQASMRLTPLDGAGSLKVEGLPLSPFWPYVSDLVDIQLQDGTLDTRGDFHLALVEGVDLKLNNTSATLTSFAARSLQDDPLARLARLHVADITLDLVRRSVRLGTVRSDRLETWINRAEDGKLNWQTIFPPARDPGQEDREAAWRVRIADAQLADSRVHLIDQQPDTPVSLDLSSLDVDVSGFDTAGNEPFALQIETSINGEGRLAAQGNARLKPVSADLQITAEKLDLQLVQSYLDPFVRVDIRNGLLNSVAKVQLESFDPLALNVNAEAEVTDLHIVDSVENRDLVRWDSLKLDGIVYGDNSLAVERARLAKPYARLIINQDLSTNLGNLVIEQPADESGSENPRTPLTIRVSAVAIEQGSLNFADFSLQPNVALTVEELTGRIGTLDNQSTAPAEIELSGQVDRYAPVKVIGTLTPFDPLNSLDVEASFRDIELTTLSPYARKFAGYRIRKGRLDLDLHYLIDGGELQADNRVLLRDLQLGERVESPDAVDLPVRLAIALLKDGQGNINITLPVQGDLNSPEFDIMPVIWQSFGNLLSRAATAPFRFIAKLIGSDEADLSHVQFTPGNAELDDQARQRLDGLAEALNDRPALRLEVEGMSAPTEEGPLVAQQRLGRELERRWKKAVDQGQVEAADSQAGVPDEQLPELLASIYQDRLNQNVPQDWAALEPGARNERMRNAILETWQNSEVLLRRLAQQRNESIKAYLVDNAGLSAQRVQLLDVGVEAIVENGMVPTPLHLGVE